MTLSQSIVESKEVAEALSYWATALGIVIAVFAGLLALSKHYMDLREARWAQALSLYRDFMISCFQNPDLNDNYWKNVDANDLTAKTRYVYFIDMFLWASDDILENPMCDDDWRNSVKVVVSEHVSYFSSPEFQKEAHVYCPELLGIISEEVNLKALENA